MSLRHTTDVRRRKLEIYKASAFPEIWVLVPWDSSARAPGLAIHVRRGEVYREESSSRAFAGWKAEEIHRALTEDPMSEPAWRALERTALAMGAREGTTPLHDPLMASVNAKLQAGSHARGHREGRTQAHMEAVAQVLEARGCAGALESTRDRELCSGLPGRDLMAAALACTDSEDFRRRIRERRSVATSSASSAYDR